MERRMEPSSREGLKRAGRVIAYAFAALGGLVTIIEFVDYASRSTRIVLICIAGAAILIPIVGFALWLGMSQKYDLLAGFAGVVASVLLGYAVAINVASTNSSEGASTSTGSSQTDDRETDPAEAMRACTAIPEERSAPPLRRTCERLALAGITAIDLDSLEPSWGAPIVSGDSGADLEYSLGQFRTPSGWDTESLGFAESSAPRYQGCQAITSYEDSIFASEVEDRRPSYFCARTDRGRIAAVFLELYDANSSTKATVVVSVWDKPQA